MASVAGMNSDSLYELHSTLFDFASFMSLSLCVVGAWWLHQSKVIGGRWMLWGMMIQGVRLLDLAYHKLNASHLIPGTYEPDYTLTYILMLIANIGLLVFAIGLFLHAKSQRGLQSRVDELVRILADRDSREH